MGATEGFMRAEIEKLEEENRLLKDKLNAFESSKFNTMALLEIQHPKTAREAENLLQYKKVFERLYNDKLYCLEEENRKLKESLDIATKCSCKEEDGIIRLIEENNKLKLHIEAKDKAYTALLKDYEELKENRKKILDEIDAEIERFKDFRKSLEK